MEKRKKNGTFMKLQLLLPAVNNNFTKHINNNQLQDLPSLLMGHLLPLADHFLVHSLYYK